MQTEQARRIRRARSARGRTGVIVVLAAALLGAASAPAALAQGETSAPTSTGPTTTVAATSTTAGSSTTVTTVTTVAGGSSTTTAAGGSSTTTAAGVATSSTVAGATTTGAPATTTTTIFTPGPTLKRGSKGDPVLVLERRLAELHYDVGDVDGKYDLQTWQAVMAFQKFTGLKRTGNFDATTQVAFQSATTPAGLLPNGGAPRVEVDISRQILMYFDESGLQRISAVSTGTGRSYCDFSKKSQKEVCGSAKTPRGNFKIQRRLKGDHESDLGHLYSPVYFSGGFAVHGSPSVPAYPASHGCVRVTNKTADWFFATVKNGTPIYLYD